MNNYDELKKIKLLQKLNDGMLDMLSPILQYEEFKADETIFEEGDKANYLYMLDKGTVLLNMSASEDVCVSVMSIEPGACFGWSSLLNEPYYTATAVCAEDSSMWVISGRDLWVLMHSDHTMGFRVMDYVARAMSNRLEKRTNQLFKALLEHIDMVCGLREVS